MDNLQQWGWAYGLQCWGVNVGSIEAVFHMIHSALLGSQ